MFTTFRLSYELVNRLVSYFKIALLQIVLMFFFCIRRDCEGGFSLG